MAKTPTLLYNFNENDSSTIRDYSEEGLNGVGSNLTVSASSRVGYDAVFNGTNSLLTASGLVNKVGSTTLGYFMSVNFTNTSSSVVFNHDNVLKVEWFDSRVFVSLTTSVNTYTISSGVTSLTTATFYDITITHSSNTLDLIIDGVYQTGTATAGVVDASTSNDLYIGHEAGLGIIAMKLNEFKIFSTAISATLDLGFRSEQNGVLISAEFVHGFNVGDILGSEVDGSSGKFSIATNIDSTTTFRIQPISDGFVTGLIYGRYGHLWDTTRQYAFAIDDTPQICFYDGVSLSSEVGSTSKKLYCLNREGIIKNSTTKTANYTVLSSDQRIYVDSSAGAFTITLEASPTTDRELEIIDSVGSCNSNTVTIDGNGNNIIGSTTYLMNQDYESPRLVFNGFNWNLN